MTSAINMYLMTHVPYLPSNFFILNLTSHIDLPTERILTSFIHQFYNCLSTFHVLDTILGAKEYTKEKRTKLLPS